jgi:uncharacterized membrane protein
MNRKFLAVSFALSLTFVSACTSSAQTTGIEQLSCAQDSTLTYENFGKQAVEGNCMSCHDTKSPALGNVEQIRSHAAQILDVAVYTDGMPQNGDMTIEERRLLGEWLACGAP